MILTLTKTNATAKIIENFGYYVEPIFDFNTFLQKSHDESISIVVIDTHDFDPINILNIRNDLKTLSETSFIFIIEEDMPDTLRDHMDAMKDNVIRRSSSKELFHFRIQQTHRIRNLHLQQETYFIDSLKRAISIFPNPYALFNPSGQIKLSNQIFVDLFPFLERYTISKQDGICLFSPFNIENLFEESYQQRLLFHADYDENPTQFIGDRLKLFENESKRWAESFFSGVNRFFTINRCEKGFTTLIVKDVGSYRPHELSKLAFEDSLTGLANRSRFYDLLEKSLLNQNTKTEKPTGIIIVDLDNFKQINDTHGHAFGDEVLKEIAQRLKNAVRYRDTVARLGGDEFAIILEHLGTSHDAGRVVNRLKDTLSRPINTNTENIIPKASFGFAIYGQHGKTPKSLLSHADRNMYDDKQNLEMAS